MLWVQPYTDSLHSYTEPHFTHTSLTIHMVRVSFPQSIAEFLSSCILKRLGSRSLLERRLLAGIELLKIVWCSDCSNVLFWICNMVTSLVFVLKRCWLHISLCHHQPHNRRHFLLLLRMSLLNCVFGFSNCFQVLHRNLLIQTSRKKDGIWLLPPQARFWRQTERLLRKSKG